MGIADSAPYLHDGRAETLADAVAAHGGEAASARDRFTHLTTQQQEALLAYLRSL
jgi:CxxC motif-containing protein (DUF1111 family)